MACSAYWEDLVKVIAILQDRPLLTATGLVSFSDASSPFLLDAKAADEIVTASFSYILDVLANEAVWLRRFQREPPWCVRSPFEAGDSHGHSGFAARVVVGFVRI